MREFLKTFLVPSFCLTFRHFFEDGPEKFLKLFIYLFRNSNSVLFHPNECESLDALTKVMGTGFAGCVHFTGVQVGRHLGVITFSRK